MSTACYEARTAPRKLNLRACSVTGFRIAVVRHLPRDTRRDVIARHQECTGIQMLVRGRKKKNVEDTVVVLDRPDDDSSAGVRGIIDALTLKLRKRPGGLRYDHRSVAFCSSRVGEGRSKPHRDLDADRRCNRRIRHRGEHIDSPAITSLHDRSWRRWRSCRAWGGRRWPWSGQQDRWHLRRCLWRRSDEHRYHND